MLLEIKDLQVIYGAGPPMVDNFNLALGKAEIVSIVGESGSGKTTILRAALGLLPAGGLVTRGDILFEGRSLLGLTREAWREIRGSRISMIFQDSLSALNPIRTIGSQYVEYIRTHAAMSRKEAWDRAALMLSKMRLPDPENILRSYAFQLSGGMRQRVGIAMAMTFNPALLLADEPTSALDVTTQAAIVREMAELRDEFGASIVLVTHNLGVASYLSDRIMVMNHGRVVDKGSRDEVLNHPQSDYTKKLLASVPVLNGERYV